MVQIRAAKGGQTVGGKFFRGGQFVTNEAIRIQAEMDGRSVATGIKKIDAAVKKAAFESFRHAAFAIRKDAIASIERTKGPSPVGTPVHTRRGLARRAVYAAADKTGAVIGFMYSVLDTAMEAHEKGLKRFKTQYPERPTMAPALAKNLDRFHREWRSSIG